MPCSTNTKQTYPTLLLQQIARNTCAIAGQAGGGVTSIAGTANQIAASSPTGAVTLSLAGPHAFSTLTATAVLLGNATSPIAASNMTYVTPVLTVPASFAITGAGSLAFNAGGANQNITLTPSGTGDVIINGAGTVGQNLLLGTTTDSSNGRLQLATHTTAAGGIGWGADVTTYRIGNNAWALNSTSTNTLMRLASNGTIVATVAINGADLELQSSSGNVLITGTKTQTSARIQFPSLSSSVTSTATAAATTTLTATSTVVQIFTGATTQTVQLPAANVLGANVGLWYVIKNRSSGNVTVQRAGADTIDGATTMVLATNDSVMFISDGSALWTAN